MDVMITLQLLVVGERRGRNTNRIVPITGGTRKRKGGKWSKKYKRVLIVRNLRVSLKNSIANMVENNYFFLINKIININLFNYFKLYSKLFC